MQLIPRIFHRIWVGPRSLPDEFRRFGCTWTDHHPGWEMKLWNESNLPPLINGDCLGLARNESQLSDILRYELLFQFGGVYLDTDFECKKNIEPLLHDLTFFGAGELSAMLSAGIFGATAQHPLIGEVIRELPRRLRLPGNQAATTGPGLLTAVWRRYRGQQGVKAYGRELFYPYQWNEKHRRNECFPQAYAVHHWAASWMPARPGKRQGAPRGFHRAESG